MIDIIKNDISRYPNIVFPFGAVEIKVLQNELCKYDFTFPPQLVEIWEEFGGGDFFQSETIFYPLYDESKENIPEVNMFYYKQGMPSIFFVFHTGIGGLTAIVKGTAEIVNIDRDTWVITKRHKSFEDWFMRIRAELLLMRYETP